MEKYEINDIIKIANTHREAGNEAFQKGYYESAKDSYKCALNLANNLIDETGLDYCNKDYLTKRINECNKYISKSKNEKELID